MTSMIRTTALAAALAAASFGALAGPVINLDQDLFELGEKAKAADSGNGAPVAVGEIKGVVFSTNAFAYHKDMLKAPPTDIDRPSDTVGAFIMNGDRNTLTSEPIVISLAKWRTDAGQFFETMALSVFSKGAVTASWTTKTGVVEELELSNPIGTTWGNWSKVATPWAASDQIDRIAFTASGTNSFIGFQGLEIGLTGSTDPNPNPAPEPAGYALVGLALLAAGAATRRRA